MLKIDSVVYFVNSFSSFFYFSSPPPVQSWSWFWQWWAGQHCYSRHDNFAWTKWFSWWNYWLQAYILPSFLLGFQDLIFHTWLKPCHTNTYKYFINVCKQRFHLELRTSANLVGSSHTFLSWCITTVLINTLSMKCICKAQMYVILKC